MKRFDDKLLIEVLEAMRTPGGRAISEEAWQAIERTEVGCQSDAAQLTAWDPRLRAARGWYDRDLCQANDAPGTGSLRSPEKIPAGVSKKSFKSENISEKLVPDLDSR